MAEVSHLEAVLGQVEDHLELSIARLSQLLRIESISTDPAYRSECRRAADWLSTELTGIGFDASVRPTEGHPMVVAHWAKAANENGGAVADAGGPRNLPHVLFYGHYDVQPPDPLELWKTPPFEPQLLDGPQGKMIVARGASDDKGQLMTFIEACRAWIAVTGGLPVNVSVLLEGEEECGSPSLDAFLAENTEELARDVALVCDTSMWDPETPAITTMLRGMVYEEVTVKAASRDLHSGHYGGPARNPIRVLSRALAALHDETGHVMIPGFYDDVPEMPDEVKQQWKSLGFDAIGFLSAIGLSVPAGETERSVLEQIWSRPSCDVNGIIGGYTGEGAKTVIPAEATAKVSFRLVGDQNPEKITESFRAFIRDRLPADCEVSFKSFAGNAAIALSTDSPYLERAQAALADEFGRPAALIGAGGSIPVVGDFKRKLGMESLLIGFALDEDQIHSPNEKYNVKSFRHGIRSWARVLDRLAA